MECKKYIYDTKRQVIEKLEFNCILQTLTIIYIHYVSTCKILFTNLRDPELFPGLICPEIE